MCAVLPSIFFDVLWYIVWHCFGRGSKRFELFYILFTFLYELAVRMKIVYEKQRQSLRFCMMFLFVFCVRPWLKAYFSLYNMTLIYHTGKFEDLIKMQRSSFDLDVLALGVTGVLKDEEGILESLCS